jgi:tyrosine-protein kinase Etk/Wzc
MTDNNAARANEYRVLDLFFTLYRWKKTIVLVTAVAAILGLILAFTVKRYYKSVASVIPPKEREMMSGLAGLTSLARALPSGLGNLTGATGDPFDYVAILRSRTVEDITIRKFNLLHVYGISDSSMEKAAKELISNTEVDWTEDNTLEIRVWDSDAQRAADIANFLVTILNLRSYELQTQEARNNRVFIEQRVQQNKEDIARTEDELRRLQEREGTIVAPGPNSTAISAVAELYGMKAVNEIELDVLKRSVGETNLQYVRKKLENEMLDNKLKKFPEIGMESLRLYREITIQQKIMEFIVPLFEQAKVDEHKDVPVAYELDKAIPGEHPDRPKRLFIAGIATFLGFVISLVIIMVNEYSSHLKANASDQWERLAAIKRSIIRRKKTDERHS